MRLQVNSVGGVPGRKQHAGPVMLLTCHLGWLFTWSHDSIDLQTTRQEATCPPLGIHAGGSFGLTLSPSQRTCLPTYKAFANAPGTKWEDARLSVLSSHRDSGIDSPPPPPPPLPQSRVYVTLMARPRQRVKGSGKVFSHRSPSMHPLLILSTFSTLILRGLLCFPWVLRSKDPMWILYGVRLRAREKSCLLSTYYIHHLANK